MQDGLALLGWCLVMRRCGAATIVLCNVVSNVDRENECEAVFCWVAVTFGVEGV